MFAQAQIADTSIKTKGKIFGINIKLPTKAKNPCKKLSG